MTSVLYVDCVSGVAGDMLLAALLDAGGDEQAVSASLAAIASGLHIETTTVTRHGIAARHVAVRAPDEHVHRRWPQVRELVDRAALPTRAHTWAHDAFRRLAEAEARVHDISAEEVHFHEVGALDALADICGVACALDSLGIERVVCSPLPVARGLVTAAHGVLPLPAPAVLEILAGAPVYGVEGDAELVTPTGAALACAISEEFGALPAMRPRATGYGAGGRDLPDRPNVVRVIVGDARAGAGAMPVRVLETNVDDLLPELVPDALAACFAAGALDVWCTPVQMKKGRPGFVLSAMARPDDEPAVAEALLRSTTTLGVRVLESRRWELERMFRTVTVAGHSVRVKVGLLDGAVVNVSPEHDDCAAVAQRTGATAAAIWAAALAAATEDSDVGAA